jgi:hypothetical protein
MQYIFSSTIWGRFKNQSVCFDKCFVIQNIPSFYFIFHVIPNSYLSSITRKKKSEKQLEHKTSPCISILVIPKLMS